MSDFTALLEALGKTCQELEEIKLEQVKDHKRLSKSFEQALLSILHQEQSILTQVEAEHNQLKNRLTSLHQDNEKALHEGVSEINSMVHQIATISSQLQTLKDSKDNRAVLEEIKEKVTEMFAMKKSILIRLKEVCFIPCQLQTLSLGEITYQEQTFGFSIPYVERSGHNFMSSTEALLSDETPPWEDSPSDTRLLIESTILNQNNHHTQGVIKKSESGRALGEFHHVPEKVRRENGVSMSKLLSPRTLPATGNTMAEDTVHNPRTVAKIKICDAENNMFSLWDSSSELKTVKVNGGEEEILGSSMDAGDENLYKHGPEDPKHTVKSSISPGSMQNTGGNKALRMSADVNPATAVHSPERRPSREREIMQNPASQSSTLPPTHQLYMSPPELKRSSKDCTHVHSEVRRIRKEMLGQDVTGLFPPHSDKENNDLTVNQEQLSGTAHWAQYSMAANWRSEECVSKPQRCRESEPITAQNGQNLLSLATSSPTDINLSFHETTDTERLHLLSNPINQDTLFRATAAFVYEDDSENSDDGPESNAGHGEEKDPKACRTVAIQASRIPSAKQNDNREQLSRWTSGDSVNKMEICSFETYVQNPSESQKSQTKRDIVQGIQSNQSWVDPSGENRNVLLVQHDFLRKSNKNSIHQDPSLSSRSPSPTESIKSSYTFIIESPRNYGSSNGTYRAGSRSASGTRLPNAEMNQRVKRSPPVISSGSDPQREKPPLQTSRRKQLPRSPANSSNAAETRSDPVTNGIKVSPKRPAQGKAFELGPRKTVSRSTSMLFIEKIPKQRKVIPSSTCHSQSAKERRDSASSTSSCRSNPRATNSRSIALQHRRRPISANIQEQAQRSRAFSKSESNLRCSLLEEDKAPYTNQLIAQFCKFGSGRAELNLPHGIHSTPFGSLYVVDYGNRRVQVMDGKGSMLQQIALEPKNYFDVAVNNKGLVALTNSTDRTVEVYSRHGKLLQIISKNLSAPRGITTNYRDEFVVADMRQGTVSALTLELTTGRQVENVIVPGFSKPYLVSSNSLGLVAVSERGFDGGCCVKVLGDDWKVLRILGLKTGLGPTLFNPWGVCVDSEGNVLVADWGQAHSVIHYPVQGPAHAVVTKGLSSPRGLALFQDCHLVVVDSMHNCIKMFYYK
ncbi:uncharacterized protein LOC115091747 [Rhinatrema bivittatum]|uniref:uncharacterized protein LOC115091747 n=1 Tax=Rhinatrema bivittatum TaxID=194408 RepID=UPI00112A0183|nr:uncharacterized protein LOC115091747 [Rhinatrema bivittatum]